jgi:hypothetical protein
MEPRKFQKKYFRLPKKRNVKQDMKIILEQAVTHEQELGDLKDIFAVVESKTPASPSLNQWQALNNRLFSQLSTARRSPSFIIKQWRDMWRATDSRWKTLIQCLICACVMALILLAAYFVGRWFSARYQAAAIACITERDMLTSYKYMLSSFFGLLFKLR